MFGHRRADKSDSGSADTHDARPGETHEQRVARLFREHNDSLLRWLRVRLRSGDEAKEVAQEAYVQLLGLNRPEEINFLRKYLFSIAGNLAQNRIKQRSFRRRADELVFFDTDQACEGRSPERIWAGSLELSVLYEALKTLTPMRRESFRLVKMEGLSVTEAAQKLNVSSRLVRRYVAETLAHCATALDSSTTSKEEPGKEQPGEDHGDTR